MGQTRIFGWPTLAAGSDFLEELSLSLFRLADSRIGVLLLMERNMGLAEYVEHGRKIDAIFSWELLFSLVSPQSPLHDGAIFLRGERIAAARIILPIPAESPATRAMGTRHRAAWGMATETDAVCIVVSEETGNVTVFSDRQMKGAQDAMELEGILRELFGT
jgi:diadenylate cyclase